MWVLKALEKSVLPWERDGAGSIFYIPQGHRMVLSARHKGAWELLGYTEEGVTFGKHHLQVKHVTGLQQV